MRAIGHNINGAHWTPSWLLFGLTADYSWGRWNYPYVREYKGYVRWFGSSEIFISVIGDSDEVWDLEAVKVGVLHVDLLFIFIAPVSLDFFVAVRLRALHRPKHMQSGHTSVAMKKLKRKAVRDTMAKDMKFFFFYLGFGLHIFDRTEGTKANGMT